MAPGLSRARANVAIIAVLSASACSDQTIVPLPDPTDVSLAGQVRLIAAERDTAGLPLETRVIDDASGVPVHLERDGTIVATTSTVDGVFLFTHQPDGEYRALSWVTPSEPSTTETRTPDTASHDRVDVWFTETLELERSGDIEVYPNPLDIHETSCYFFLPVGRDISLTIRDLNLDPVATLLDGYENAGLRSVRWKGLDDAGNPVVAGVYWAVLDVEGASRSELILVDEDVPSPVERVFGWTISSSDADPFANSHPAPTPGPVTLYLWLACGNDFEGAAFRIETNFPGYAMTPQNGFHVLSDAVLATECRAGPIVVGRIDTYDLGAGGRLCLLPTELGTNAAYDCLDRELWPNAFIGYSNDGTPPCRSAIPVPCESGR